MKEDVDESTGKQYVFCSSEHHRFKFDSVTLKLIISREKNQGILRGDLEKEKASIM